MQDYSLKMKGNVLILTNAINGLYNFRKEVIKAIVDANYNVIISSPDLDYQNEKSDYFKSIGCKMEYTPFARRGTNPIKDLQLIYRYIKLIRKYNPQIVLTYTIKPNIYGGIATSICGKKQFANITGLGTSLMNPGILQKLNILLYRIGLQKANIVFFQNEANLEFCKKNGILQCKSILLPGSGVNLEHNKPIKYPENDDIIRFGFAGRLMHDKGIYELVECFKNLYNKYGNKIQLLIAGSYEEHCEGIIEDLQNKGIINYLGELQNIRVLMGQIHCLIHPSHHEGMSNVIQEASAAARPVIASNINGCKEIIDNNVTGFLFEVKKSSDLEDKIVKFLSLSYDERKAMGLAAREKMEREFDRQIVVKAYLDQINNI